MIKRNIGIVLICIAFVGLCASAWLLSSQYGYEDLYANTDAGITAEDQAIIDALEEACKEVDRLHREAIRAIDEELLEELLKEMRRQELARRGIIEI